MFPILVDIAELKVVLAGDGQALERRLALVDQAGGGSGGVVFCATPSATLREAAGDRLMARSVAPEDFDGARIVMIAGLSEAESKPLAAAARHAGALVNCEDILPLCDFHMPATVRRGDLTLTVSTGGASPGLARRLRRYLEGLFGPEWADRLGEVASRRSDWRAEGVSMAEVGQRTDALIDRKGWLS